MKKFRFIAYFVLAAATLGFSACQEIDDYKAGEYPEGAQVYFDKDNPTSLKLSVLEDSFSVKLWRAEVESDLEVNIITTMADGTDAASKADTLVFPTSVKFEAGAPDADLVINYDGDLMGFDKYYTFTLAIDSEDNLTPYGIASLTMKVGIPAPWKSLGMGKYYDDWFFGDYTDVEIQQNEVFPTQFRIVKPYYVAWTMMAEWGYSNYMDNATKYGDEYLNFFVIDPSYTGGAEDLVAWEDCITSFYYPNYSKPVMICHPSGFKSLQDPSNWEHSYIKYYQENGLPGEIQLAPYYYMDGVGGWNYTQSDGMISIIFPGVVLLDLSVTVEKTGMFTNDEDGAEYVMAAVEIGDDVAEARGVVVPGDFYEDEESFYGAVALVASEDPEDYVSIDSNGEYKFPMPADAEAGLYSVVVITLDPEGELSEFDYDTFEYFPAGDASPWVSAGTATFVYTSIFGNEDDTAYYDEGLEIEFNAAEGQFRVLHALYDVTFVFSVDKNANVDFEPQNTGAKASGYPIYIFSNETGKYNSEVGFFALNTKYYAVDGNKAYDLGYDPTVEYIVFDDCMEAFEEWLENQGGGDEPPTPPTEEDGEAGVTISDWEVEQGAGIAIEGWEIEEGGNIGIDDWNEENGVGANIGDWNVEQGRKAYNRQHHSRILPSTMKAFLYKAPEMIVK